MLVNTGLPQSKEKRKSRQKSGKNGGLKKVRKFDRSMLSTKKYTITKNCIFVNF